MSALPPELCHIPINEVAILTNGISSDSSSKDFIMPLSSLIIRLPIIMAVIFLDHTLGEPQTASLSHLSLYYLWGSVEIAQMVKALHW